MYVEKCQFLIGNVQRLQYRRRMLSSDNKVSIPHRQCTTTVFINCFLYLTPHFLKNQPFPPQKVRRSILYQSRYNPHVYWICRHFSNF